MGLRLAAVIRVRNEIDIIESFIRHHAVYFDCMLVLDDGSVDGTYELLCALRDEGLPLILERTVSVGMTQATDVTRLSRLAVEEHAADWIIPIDADEFIEPPAGLSLRDVLATLPAEVRTVGWSGFLWSRDQDEKADISPVLRLTDRLPPRKEHVKVIIPAAVVRDDDFRVSIGNHRVGCRGAILEAPLLAGLELCHYPIRSRAQYASKVVLSYLQLRASPTYKLGEGFQYDEAFSLIGTEAIVSTMESESRRYSVAPDFSIDENARHAPLRYVGGPLTHHRAEVPWLANILAFAEAMALRFAHQAKQGAVLAEALAGLNPHPADASPMDRVMALQERLRSSDAARADSDAARADSDAARANSDAARANSDAARADLESRLAAVQAELSASIALVEQRNIQNEALEEASRRDGESLRAAGQEVARVTALNEALQANCTSLGERLSESERGLSQIQTIAEKQAAELSRRLVRLARWLSPALSPGETS